MEQRRTKNRPSIIPKIKSNQDRLPKKKKVISKMITKVHTKSQASIPTFFKSKERSSDSNRNSENKRASVNSGTIATTTSTNKKLQNFSSIGSLGTFGNRKNSKQNPKATIISERETATEEPRGKSSLSPESDYMNMESARKSNLPSQNESTTKNFKDHNPTQTFKRAALVQAKAGTASQNYLDKVHSEKKRRTNQFGFQPKISPKLVKTGRRKEAIGNRSPDAKPIKESRTVKGMRKQLEKLQNKYHKKNTQKNWSKFNTKASQIIEEDLRNEEKSPPKAQNRK
ncbi:unnamed protein product [Moneuplotes crassus]|uniref:Uncharacterized protein n=1 Tax=Euplotes crassus TaxID=5936 RepID=A0AAD2D694_EUPCR|nr:unnamed protein product [Moneuplotes crassus]